MIVGYDVLMLKDAHHAHKFFDKLMMRYSKAHFTRTKI
jgi:hypothetical protein